MPSRRQRARRGEARPGPEGMNLLAEYDHRTQKLPLSTSSSASVVASRSGESGHV